MTTPTDEIVQAAIEGLEAKKRHINKVIGELRQRMNGGTSASAPSPTTSGRRPMSAAARRRIAEAQRKRWAALKGGKAHPASPAAKSPKRHISPEGRRRIIAATKKRWAAFRAAQKAGK